jgi:hypothetical protein
MNNEKTDAAPAQDGEGPHGSSAGAVVSGEAAIVSVVRSRKFRTSEELAADISRIIVQNKLTEVIMVGETHGRGVAKSYTWMISSRILWFSKQLEFFAMHGRFPNQDADKGGPI